MIPSRAGTNPYVGLRPFDSADSLYFFGRRDQTSALLERLKQNRFLAVVGSSGCGKSSLIRAGLIPALLGGFLVDQRDRWVIAILKPGDAPMLNLASAICSAASRTALPADAESLEKAMVEDQVDGVANFVRAKLGSDTNLLVLVDQFEEIFSFRGSEDDEQLERLSAAVRRERGQKRAEATNFVDLILGLAELENLPVYVVLTMRSDFLGDCDVFYGLPEAMNDSRYLVPRLTRQQLRDAVQGPARLSGVEITSRLMDTVLNDLGGRTDQLPVLQHALLRTWNEWRKTGQGGMDLPLYETVGGLKGALSKHAGEAIRAEDVAETGKIFKCLTGTDLNQRRIRRPAHLKELVAVCGGKAEVVNAIVERFQSDGRNFLVVSKARDGDRRIDISHESLIRQWPQLRDWIDQERDSRDQYLDLLRSARGKKALLQDPDLQQAFEWRTRSRPSREWAQRYSAGEADFDAAMKYLDDSRQAALATAREQKRVQMLFRATVIVAMILLMGMAVYALREKTKAENQRASAQLAETRAKSAESVAQQLRLQSDAYAGVIQSQFHKRSTPIMAEPSHLPAAAPSVPAPASEVQPKAVVASPVTLPLTAGQRSITYRNVSLNGQGNTINATPGQTFTISFQWQGSVPSQPSCPTCIVQIYYGMNHQAGGASKCFVSDLIGQGWSKSGDVKGVLTAPSAPGTYYITQASTLQYSCQESQAQQSSDPKDALAAVVVP